MMAPDKSLFYLASPYSNYITLDAAARDVSVAAAKLIQRGYRVFSPIAHSHPIAVHGGLDPLDHDFWLGFDESMMAVCDAMMIVTLDGWDRSRGVAKEISIFEAAGKPIYLVNPDTLEVVSK